MPQPHSTSSTSPTRTLRHAPYTYLHLSLLTPNHSSQPTPQPDEITVRLHIQSALKAHLGLHGAAIGVDVLKVSSWDSDSGVGQPQCWIRVAREDEGPVVGALSAWVGGDGVVWRVEGRGGWLGGVR